MNWIKIKDVLPPEIIRNILDKREILMIKYYVKPREVTCYTTILFEYINKQKEIVPYVIEVCERGAYRGPGHVIVLNQRTGRYKDPYILTSEEYNKFKAIFELLGFEVV